jgi:hypothetical protein
MAAQGGVSVGVSLVPMTGFAKAWQGDNEGEKSNFHKSLSVAMSI